MRSFGDRFYREQVTKNQKNPADILRYLENELYPALGQERLKDVTVLEVQALVYRKRDHGRIAAAMALRRVIKQMFDCALELRLVTTNPATMIASRYIGKARKRFRVLSAREIRLYLRTIYQSNMRRQFKLALHILLLTMARKSELLLARWEHVNLETGEWLVLQTNAKNGKPNTVYLSTHAASLRICYVETQLDTSIQRWEWPNFAGDFLLGVKCSAGKTAARNSDYSRSDRLGKEALLRRA